MSPPWMPPNEPQRYDRARVARLQPIEQEIGGLKLPLIRYRKLNGIRNALEMQIEDGGDHPEVNRLLLQALREAVIHQVGPQAGRRVLNAIQDFERAEAERWRQMKAGTLAPIELTAEEELDDLMQEGYDLLAKGETVAACDLWLEAWERVKAMATAEMGTATAFDEAYPALMQSVFNWSSDLEMELHNAGVDHPLYHQRRVRYIEEYLDQFADEDERRCLESLRARGEALWALGHRAEAEAVYQGLVERAPDHGWGYIGWSDHYWEWSPPDPKEYERAEAILQQALARPGLKDRIDVLDRLQRLYEAWGQPGPQAEVAARLQALRSDGPLPADAPRRAAPARPPAPPGSPGARPGRNDPCWCGSGRKYKRCHLREDERRGR